MEDLEIVDNTDLLDKIVNDLNKRIFTIFHRTDFKRFTCYGCSNSEILQKDSKEVLCTKLGIIVKRDFFCKYLIYNIKKIPKELLDNLA